MKLSQTSKLGCKSWSLQAGDTCPGSYANGALVPACAGCYAKSGNYRFANVKAPREFNRTDWKRPEWVSDMVAALNNEKHFRWFDSGDMYALGLAEKIYEVMRRTPYTLHWLPTRMWKFPKFRFVIDAMQQLDNVVVRFSSDSVTGETVDGTTTSTIVPSAKSAPSGVKVCRAYERDGKCGSCRSCWKKSVPVIAYVAHGRSMAKVIRIATAN